MDKNIIECYCGFQLLVIPDLAEMGKAIRLHAQDKHSKNPKDKDKVINDLSQKTLLKASEFFREAKENHADITQLGEYDTWVNDATRKDIENVLALYGEGDIFGVHVWSFNKYRGKELRNMGNFGVSYLYLATNEKKVDKAIKAYQDQNDGSFNSKATWKLINTLEKLSVQTCTWV